MRWLAFIIFWGKAKHRQIPLLSKVNYHCSRTGWDDWPLFFGGKAKHRQIPLLSKVNYHCIGTGWDDWPLLFWGKAKHRQIPLLSKVNYHCSRTGWDDWPLLFFGGGKGEAQADLLTSISSFHLHSDQDFMSLRFMQIRIYNTGSGIMKYIYI